MIGWSRNYHEEDPINPAIGIMNTLAIVALLWALAALLLCL